MKFDAVLTMQTCDVRAGLGTQDAQHRLRKSLVNADRASLLARYGRDLTPDEPGACDVERFSATEHRAQAIRRWELAKVHGALEARQVSRVGSGADAQQVPTDRLAAFQQHRPLA